MKSRDKLANFSHFSQKFRNQRKILRWFVTHIQICEEKVFRSYYLVELCFYTSKPNSQKRLKIVKNMFYKSFLELLFTPIYQ
jgi:hypothetical protein